MQWFGALTKSSQSIEEGASLPGTPAPVPARAAETTAAATASTTATKTATAPTTAPTTATTAATIVVAATAAPRATTTAAAPASASEVAEAMKVVELQRQQMLSDMELNLKQELLRERNALKGILADGFRDVLSEELQSIRGDSGEMKKLVELEKQMQEQREQGLKIRLDDLQETVLTVKRLVEETGKETKDLKQPPVGLVPPRLPVPTSNRKKTELPIARRKRGRHHTWHNQDSSSLLDGSKSPSPCKIERSSPSARVLLKLPSDSLRSVIKSAQQARTEGEEPTALDCLVRSGASPSAAAALEAAQSVSKRRAEDGLALPSVSEMIKTPQAKEIDELEIKSEIRSEENEQWKHQWTRQMKARVSSQLGRHESSHMKRSVSRFLGEEASVRHRTKYFAQIQPKSKIEKMVDSPAFNILCGLAIMANAVYIGILSEISAKNATFVPPRGDPEWFSYVNRIFVAGFTVEVLLRLIAKKWGFILGEEWKWNAFDVILVIYCIAEELLSGFSITYARLLRGFRMVRVLKVIRVMRLFRELRLMVCSIVQSLVSLSWALLLLLLIMYLFTICFMHASTMYLHEGGVPEVREPLEEWYGSVGSTMYTLLLAISGGDDWANFATPLAKISWIYKVLFAFYVMFVIIGVLNVLTSAFVQRACELSRLDRDLVIQSEMVSNESFLAEMKGIFEEVDDEGTGCINWNQFRTFILDEKVQAYFQTQQLDTSDARELFNLLDQDGDGEVCIEEFIMGCKKLRGQAKSSDVATLLRENKRANQKNQRAMRKLEAQLDQVSHGLVSLGVSMTEGAPWSPQSNFSSCRDPLTPATGRSSRYRIPIVSRQYHSEGCAKVSRSYRSSGSEDCDETNYTEV